MDLNTCLRTEDAHAGYLIDAAQLKYLVERLKSRLKTW